MDEEAMQENAAEATIAQEDRAIRKVGSFISRIRTHFDACRKFGRVVNARTKPP
jgi:hypothetical protein